MKHISKKALYCLIVLISTFWGLSFLATSVLINYLEPYQIQSARWLVASCVFLVMILTGKLHIGYKKKGFRYVLLLGAFEPCLYMTFETYGIAMTSSSTSAIFVATIPTAVLLINGLFLRKKISAKGVVGILLAFLGVICCTVFKQGFSIQGDSLGCIILFSGVLSGALYSILSNKIATDFEPMEMTATMAFVGAIYFGVMNFILGFGVKSYTIYFADARLLGCILFLGVCCSAICYLCFNKILGIMDAAIGNSLATSMTTVVGSIAGIVIAGDTWGVYTIIGIILTLLGVVLSSTQIDNKS